MLTRLAAGAAALVLLPTLAACGGGSSSTTAQDPASTTRSASPTASATGGPVKAGQCAYPVDPAGAAKKVNPPSPKPTVKGQVKTTITTSVGTFHATLDAKKTPCTVNSFVSLAQQGFYDKTPCHRLTTAGIYVLQCGDPSGTGRGGPGYTIPDEISGHEKYPAGTLAMANTGQPNSGGSQFFMVYKNTPLPAAYTVFGHFDRATVKLLTGVAKKGTDNAFGQGDGHPKQAVTITKVTTG